MYYLSSSGRERKGTERRCGSNKQLGRSSTLDNKQWCQQKHNMLLICVLVDKQTWMDLQQATSTGGMVLFNGKGETHFFKTRYLTCDAQTYSLGGTVRCCHLDFDSIMENNWSPEAWFEELEILRLRKRDDTPLNHQYIITLCMHAHTRKNEPTPTCNNTPAHTRKK